MGWTYILLEGHCTRKWPDPRKGYKVPKKLFRCPLKKCSKRGEEIHFRNVPQAACLTIIGNTPKSSGRRCPYFAFADVSLEFQRLKAYKDLWRKQTRLERMFEKAKKRLGKKPSTKALNKLWDDCMRRVGGR